MIAIVGIGCRFPGGVTGPESFWQLLKNGVDAITEVPSDRWGKHFFNPNRSTQGKTYTKWGGFVDGVDQFDASFFGISPREAALLDPQQRLLMETTYEALEDAGMVVERLAGTRTGVFMGGFTLDWQALQFADSNQDVIESHTATGAMMTLLANRLSYVFDFRGPSVAVDTACSSSMVAVHLAVQSLLGGETDLAVVGGVNVMVKPNITIAESKAGMLSPTGRSKTFDDSANGYVRGEGAGVVVLKPFEQALADGDDIYALIRGTACNQDGHSEGLTVPSGDAQQELVREALARAGVQPHEIQYLEAHGTGTPVGDPIEANALGTVLQEGRSADRPCYIASVKTNFGHTEAAAGVAGLIKTALCLKNGEIPAHLHLQNVNPKIDFDAMKMVVPLTHTAWPDTHGLPRLAGVNSFGFGGTNAHAVLQDAESAIAARQPVEHSEVTKPVLVPLTARNEKAVAAFASKIQDHLEKTDVSLTDLGYTLTNHRALHGSRLAVVASSKQELIDKLATFQAGESAPGLTIGSVPHGGAPKMAFVYTGMGPQWWAMGHQLLQQEPIFRAVAEQIDAKFKALSGWSLLDEMLKSEEESRMIETEVAQPANFLIQVALTSLYRSWGIKPDAIIGHSAGEVASAYEAGSMTLDEAVRVIYHRSRLQQKTTGQGRLVAIGLPAEQAKQAMAGYEDRVSFAAINSPSSVTLVGDPEALEKIVEPLQEQQVFCRFLNGKVPYHSHYLEPLKGEFYESMGTVELQDTAFPLYSTVTGGFITGPELDTNYWWRNNREPVFFADAMAQMIEDGYRVFVEIGPHPVLASSIRECLTVADKQGVTLTSLRRNEPELPQLLEALGGLYTQGIGLNWQAFFPQGNRVKLPTYPWQREKCWHESERSRLDRLGENIHPLLGKTLRAPHPRFETDIDLHQLHWIGDHRIQNSIVYPGAGYAEMMTATVMKSIGEGKPAVEVLDIEFKKALFIGEDETVKLQVHLDSTTGFVGVYRPGAQEGDWTNHAEGYYRPINRFPIGNPDLTALQARITHEIPKEKCYQHFRTLGLEYGPTFQGIHQLWQGENEALAQVEIHDLLQGEVDDFYLHPAMLDLCFQVLAAALPFRDDESSVYMPTALRRAYLRHAKLTKKMWIHARITDQTNMLLAGDIQLLDEDGNLILDISKCEARSLRDESAGGGGNISYSELVWSEQERNEVEATPQTAGMWMVFADGQGVADALSEQLKAKGDSVLRITRGDEFAILDGNASLNPTDKSSYQQLIQWAQTQPICKGVVHLWSLDAVSGDDATIADLRQAEDFGCASVLLLTKQLAQGTLKQNPLLWLVTRGAQPVLHTQERLQVAQAPLWGLARVLGHQEHTDIWGGILDLDATEVNPAVEAEQILHELLNKTIEDQIGFRRGVRYVVRVQDCGDLTLPIPPKFRPDASYLITGGLGGLGIQVARWSIEQGARRIVLSGREALPPRSTWSDIDPTSKLGERIAAVRELEALGASITVIGCDVSNRDDLFAQLAAYEAEGWPAIRGVVHSAGVAFPQTLLQMELEDLSNVLHPKIFGSWNLHNYFKDRELDFFVLFSSLAAQIVSPGQGNYSAGNAFLDALAYHRQAQGLPALSINWGPWAEVGMATKLDLIEFFERRGMYQFSPEKGLNAYGNLLLGSKPNVLVCIANWSVVAQHNYPGGLAPAMILDIAAADQEASNGQQNNDGINFLETWKEAEESDRLTLLEDHLQDVVAHVMRLNRSSLTSDQPLNSLGLDSMLAIELRVSLEKGLNVKLAVVELLKGPTISELADSLHEQMVSNLELSQDEEVADLLAELGDMSEEEMAALLEAAATTVSEDE
ncbi:type I polyketide synthase [Tumebacillus sp. ITR2]|uniref:Type I polyketide synthase n=2 Tax=Tumebacillus amylolyticus TaxID=2801339 RepID=A0ABS1J9Z0_9BACL|nr:type I polyketide synthase [Tumebacillus amylolyticus]